MTACSGFHGDLLLLVVEMLCVWLEERICQIEEARKHTLELISTEGKKFLETGVSYDCPRQAGARQE